MWRYALVPGLLYVLVMVLTWRLVAGLPDRWSVVFLVHVLYLVWLVLWFVPVVKRWFRARFVP